MTLELLCISPIGQSSSIECGPINDSDTNFADFPNML